MTDRKPAASAAPFDPYRLGDQRASGRRRMPNTEGGADHPAPDGRGRTHPGSRSSFHRRSGARRGLVVAGLALAGLATAVATFFIAVPPAALLKDEIVRMVKDKTGRDLLIGGPVSFTLFPSPGLAMSDVSLAGPPGADGRPLVTMANLEMNVAFLPLLQRRAEIERLALRRPVFDLEVDREGRRNWRFAATTGSRGVRLAEATSPGARHDVDAGPLQPDGGGPVRPLFEPLLRHAPRNIAIEDGTVRYADARKERAYEISAVDARVTLDTLSRPLAVEGSAVSSGETLTFNGTLESLSAVLDDQPSRLSLNVEGRPLTAFFDGSLALRDGPAAEGALKARGDSTERLAQWLGGSAAALRGPFAIDGRLKAAPKVIAIEEATFEIGGTAASGNISVESSGQRPFWRADLKLAELDLGKLNAGSPEEDPAAGQASPAPVGAPDPSTGDPVRREGPAVNGWRAGWSGEPIDWSFVGAADGDLALRAEKTRIGDVETGPGDIRLALKDRTLKATVENLALYGGRGQGTLSVDATGETPIVAANVTAEGVDAGTLLKDAAGLDWLGGTGNIALALTARGGSERQIVETLAGTANIALADGVIAGLDTDGLLGGHDGTTAARQKRAPGTSFSALTATFNIKGGVAENRDLRLTSTLVQARGAGKVLLANRAIDYTLRPKLASTPQSADAEDGSSGLEVPVRVTGSWDKPKFDADLAGVVKDPDKAVAAIKEIGKKLKGKKFGDIMRGLFGDDAGGKDESRETPEP